MDASTDNDVGRFPRHVRWLGIIALGLALTLLFAVWLFPYPRLARALSDRSEALVGIQFHFNELGPTLGLGGIGIEATQVRATMPRGETLVIPRIALRPAFTLGWLTGNPALAVDLEGGGLGKLEGDVSLGATGGFVGSLERVALPLLPLEQAVAGLHMEGHVSGKVDVTLNAEGEPEGHLDFEAVDGSIDAPGMPMGLPFKTFTGKLELGGEQYAIVEKLEFTGPMLYAKAVGNVGHSEQAGREPLDMELKLRPVANGMLPALRELGIRAKAGQPTTLQITGTLSRPTFR